MSDVTCRFMCVVIFVPCLQPAQLETIGEVVYSYQYKYISIYIFKRVCVLCACVNVHLYVFMCMCLYLCVCVCSCVCASDCVRACACVPVCGVCVRVCVVKSWRPGLRSMCVCVCGNVEPCRLESTPGRKRERTPTRGHRRFNPPPPRATRV